ncbi:unnamed protein product [Tuber melanosporum]|uniref:Signal recognition particle subunit SRP72 n=1 Tax=Tuber melanosporum (strain Mel28) TaxID=656061 RepID=D5GNN8_TUBMM|nr:uncharacterized protein GSTUM_00011392001 [Tuber melanosporum]CAZ86131.1 unnamed protein product [Tuber melanosporum]
MSQYTPATLESLLSTLSITGDADHASVLKHANNVLKSEKSHKRALHTKAVALINLDRYEDAFSVLSVPELAGEAVLERAYCLYKLGRLEDALAAAVEGARSGGRDERGLRHVEAQAAYRLEKFDQAAGIYAGLSRGGYQAENEDYDMRVNISATNAQLIWANGSATAGGDNKVDRSALDAFETAFNSACGAVARCAFGQALVLLKRARELGLLLEDLSEEERKVEVAPVLAQEAYVLAKMGRWEEALERSKELDVPSITDTSLKVVATNNEIAITSRLPDYNPHLSLIASAELATTSASSKAFLFQSRILDRNHAVLELEAGKTQASKKQALAHLKNYPHDNEASVILAAAREGKVEKLVKKSPGDLGLSLTLAQLCMRSGNITGAIAAVENVISAAAEDQKYLPGVIGLLVGLYQHQGRCQHVRDILSKASEHWKNSPTPNHPLLRASAKAHLDNPTSTDIDLHSAHSIFTILLNHSPSDPFATAGLLASTPSSSASSPPPQHLQQKLTPLEKLISTIDVAALEAAGVAQPPPRKRPTEEAEGLSGKVGVKVVYKKKAHKFDTSKTPDPERWLPLWDRSGYKPKGKKGRGRVGGGGATQGGGGGGTGGEESMELAGGGRVDVLKVNANKAKKKKKGGKR